MLAGAAALGEIGREGLRPERVAAVAAAAGGPKGLVFVPLDIELFERWLPQAPRRRLLAGASIGAWRMAAAADANPRAALERLREAYLEQQRYPRDPSTACVAATCRSIVEATIGDPADYIRRMDASLHLQVVVAHARGPLAMRTDRASFMRAALSNLWSRGRLAAHLQRVVFELDRGSARGASVWPDDPFDGLHVPLDERNLIDALLASGTIPLLADPVRDLIAASPGCYWDGGLVDYHLCVQWSRLDGLVLYPHFEPHLTPGWLDKSLPWRRRAPRGCGSWLGNVVLLMPSAQLLRRLPAGRLPERADFYRYGTDHDTRIRNWRQAIAECEALVEEFDAFCRRPDPARIEAL